MFTSQLNNAIISRLISSLSELHMLLCLDIGNTHICGGLFSNYATPDAVLCLQFRYPTMHRTSDELGVFLKQVIRENQYDPQTIQHIAVCSVVPSLDASVYIACEKYFDIKPWFLTATSLPDLNIHYTNPKEVGADRLANAVAAITQYPRQNLIILDCGTATTFCVIDAHKNYLGGAIAPGIRLAAESLALNTAKLPKVEIAATQQVIGRNTVDSINSGVFFGALGACREIISRITTTCFAEQPVTVIATGGFASFFAEYNLYNHYLPDLVLHGLRIAYL